jgi:hypothetical protein
MSTTRGLGYTARPNPKAWHREKGQLESSKNRSSGHQWQIQDSAHLVGDFLFEGAERTSR